MKIHNASTLKNCYSFWKGVKYIIALSLMLWWLPIFGQMVAGYVGGRKTGHPLKGIAAALVPVNLLLIFNIITRVIIPGYAASWPQWPHTQIVPDIATSFMSAYVRFSFLYIAMYFISINQLIGLQPSVYAIIVVFAFIGGLMAQQTQKEIALIIDKLGGNICDVPRARTTNAALRSAKSERMSGIHAAKAPLDKKYVTINDNGRSKDKVSTL